MSGVYARRISVVAATAALAATSALFTAPGAQATMPTPVSAATDSLNDHSEEGKK